MVASATEYAFSWYTLGAIIVYFASPWQCIATFEIIIPSSTSGSAAIGFGFPHQISYASSDSSSGFAILRSMTPRYRFSLCSCRSRASSHFLISSLRSRSTTRWHS